MSEICRKDSLTRNMSRMIKMFPKEYSFYPKAWCLPAEYDFIFYYLSSRLIFINQIVIVILLNIVRRKNIKLTYQNLMLVVKVEEYL
jgi:hypothetical protein